MTLTTTIPDLVADDRDKAPHCWHYVYLHGLAEQRMGTDIVGSSQEKPDKEGEYHVKVLGEDAIAVLSTRGWPSSVLHGRVYLISDKPEVIEHCRSPEAWR